MRRQPGGQLHTRGHKEKNHSWCWQARQVLRLTLPSPPRSRSGRKEGSVRGQLEEGRTSQCVPQGLLGLVQGRLSVFVADADQRPTGYQVLAATGREGEAGRQPLLATQPTWGYGQARHRLLEAPTHLRHLLLGPETGVMERGVAVLVGGIDVCLELDQLHRERREDQGGSGHWDCNSSLPPPACLHAPPQAGSCRGQAGRPGVPTFWTMSRCPWLAARCRGVSSPRFMTLMRAPRITSMSTTLERPSRQAQCRGLKPWSSLAGRQEAREAVAGGRKAGREAAPSHSRPPSFPLLRPAPAGGP